MSPSGLCEIRSSRKEIVLQIWLLGELIAAFYGVEVRVEVLYEVSSKGVRCTYYRHTSSRNKGEGKEV